MLIDSPKGFLVAVVSAALVGVSAQANTARCASLDKAAFFAQLKPQYGPLRACHQAEGERDPMVRGRYRLTISFSKRGRVATAQATSVDLRQVFLDCVVTAVKRWRVRRLPNDIRVIVPMLVLGPGYRDE